MGDDDRAIAALLQSLEPFEDPRLDERRADRALDKDEAIAHRGGEDALRTEERASHRGNGQQPHDRYDHQREHEHRREQQAEEQLHERERGGEPLRRMAGLGEPVALGDVARQRPRQRAQAPGDQLEIRRGQERLGPPSL